MVEDLTRELKEVTEELLSQLGIVAQVAARAEAETLWGEIETDDQSLMIGYRGGTLAALEYLVRTLILRRGGERLAGWEIHLDVGGYKERQRAELAELAASQAAKVRASGAAAVLRPMTAFERRIVHLTLADDADVVTESIGLGPSRRIIVKPKRQPSVQEK